MTQCGAFFNYLLIVCLRLDCERRLRQDAEDKNAQLVSKLNFDTRLHEQVNRFNRYPQLITSNLKVDVNLEICLLQTKAALWKPAYTRAYFKQDLQRHKTWQSANWKCNSYNCTLNTANFDFTTAQIVIDCMFKYALVYTLALYQVKSDKRQRYEDLSDEELIRPKVAPGRAEL